MRMRLAIAPFWASPFTFPWASPFTSRQLSNSLLDNCGIRPRLGKPPHIHQVGPRESLHIRKCGTQILRQPLYDLRTPALFGLPREDVAADLPGEQHQFAVDRQRGALPGTKKMLWSDQANNLNLLLLHLRHTSGEQRGHESRGVKDWAVQGFAL